VHLSFWLTIINFGLLVLIWLVQVIIYPSFGYIDRDKFTAWHTRYVKTIGIIVSPLMVAQMLLTLLLTSRKPEPFSFLMLSGILVIWISTFSLSVPCHRKLMRLGKDTAIIRRLVLTNWVRTILWTAVFLTGLISR